MKFTQIRLSATDTSNTDRPRIRKQGNNGCHMLNPDDKQLVDRLLAGEETAFNQFFNEYFAKLFRFALSRLNGDEEAAKDVVQRSFTKAISKLESYRGESRLFTWLCTICRNESIDWLRKQGRDRDRFIPIEDNPDIQLVVDTFRADAGDEPDARLEREQALKLIQVALDTLPANYGNALEWKYVDGRSVAEIARRLEVGPEAAQSLLARARRAFAEVYKAMLQASDDNVVKGQFV